PDVTTRLHNGSISDRHSGFDNCPGADFYLGSNDDVRSKDSCRMNGPWLVNASKKYACCFCEGQFRVAYGNDGLSIDWAGSHYYATGSALDDMVAKLLFRISDIPWPGILEARN